MRKRRKLWLINVRYRDEKGRLPRNGVPVNNVINHPTVLPLLAAYTPEHYDIRLLDEGDYYLNSSILDGEVDLVGITTLTPSAPRGYELAKYFRQRGVKVVMGGVHVSMVPDEALAYADSVVLGEADWVWPQVLEDFENDRLQQRYVGKPQPLDNLPLPRWDLFETKTWIKQFQTGRGCPFNCEFCSVAAFNGRGYRWRPIAEVVREVELLGDKALNINDDNTVGYSVEDQKRAIDLFNALKPLHKKFDMTCVSINMADNDRLLKAASDAGLLGVLIGFESITEEALKAMGKGINLKTGVNNFKEKIRKIQSYGIAVMGSFVFGYDSDTPDTFKRVAEFVNQSEMVANMFFVLTPLPGTRLYSRLDREGRILYKNFPRDWARYGQMEPVFQPRGMSIRELREGLAYVYHHTTTVVPALRRGLRIFSSTGNAKLGLRSTVFNALPWPMLEKTAKLIR